MADKCGSCDCADKSQCVKKGSSNIIDVAETENSYLNMDAGAENDCKCGSSCTCTSCTCSGCKC